MHLHWFTGTHHLVSDWSKQFTGLLSSLYWRLLLSYMPTCSPDNPGTLVRVPLFLKARLGQMMNAFSDKKIIWMFTFEKWHFLLPCWIFAHYKTWIGSSILAKRHLRQKNMRKKENKSETFFLLIIGIPYLSIFNFLLIVGDLWKPKKTFSIKNVT